MRRGSLLLILLTAWGMTSARVVRAQEASGAAGAMPAPAIRLVLSLPSDGTGPLAPERLRAELAAELQRPIVAGGATDDPGAADVLAIAWAAERRELTVRYEPAAGGRVTRTVAAPGNDAEVAALALLLAGNIARDQAAELLGPPRRPPASPSPTPLRPIAPLPDGDRASTTIARARPAPGSELEQLLHRLRMRQVAWTATRSLFNVALRASDRISYAQIGLSGHVEGSRSMIGPGLTVGARIPLGRLACDTDIGVTYLNGVDELPTQTHSGYTNNRIITRARSALVISLGLGIDLFAGFGYALTTHFYGDPATNKWGPEVFGGVQL